MANQLHRRMVLTGLGAAGLAGCATTPSPPFGVIRPTFQPRPFAPLITHRGRISRITVCTRPFRAQGPRIEAEVIGDKRVVHNYGHGGSGWSLSWGSAAMARDIALDGGTRPVAVIGCGAIGLTSALQILRGGAPVTIYAAERTPYTRSARATGVWSPDSRIAAEASVTADFGDRWEAMSRQSWRDHHAFIGVDGDPVRFIEQYNLRGGPTDVGPVGPEPTPGSVGFFRSGDRLNGLAPWFREVNKTEHPFPVESVRCGPVMTFNVAEYARQLTEAFLLEGGRIVQRTFNHPSELATLTEPVVVNCSGYGARALFGDRSVTPVRGQIAWLTPQPEVTYALWYRSINMVPRHDGIVIQANGSSQMVGYGVEDETPDRDEAVRALEALAPLFASA